MSTYVALLEGGRREETITVTPEGPGVYRVELGGAVHRVDAFRHDYGTVSLIVDAESYSVQLDVRGGAGGGTGQLETRVHLRGSTYPLEILDERRLRMRRASGHFSVEGRQILAAPMPGRVSRVLVRPGDEVRAGQTLVVLDAMKMENELKSARDGRVSEVWVVPGQVVAGGARLAAVE